MVSAEPAPGDPGLVAYWRFDAATNALPDLSGHGHTAQLANVKAVVENGRTVLALDGTQKILVPSHPDLNLRRGFSMVARDTELSVTDRFAHHRCEE